MLDTRGNMGKSRLDEQEEQLQAVNVFSYYISPSAYSRAKISLNKCFSKEMILSSGFSYDRKVKRCNICKASKKLCIT